MDLCCLTNFIGLSYESKTVTRSKEDNSESTKGPCGQFQDQQKQLFKPQNNSAY